MKINVKELIWFLMKTIILYAYWVVMLLIMTFLFQSMFQIHYIKILYLSVMLTFLTLLIQYCLSRMKKKSRM